MASGYKNDSRKNSFKNFREAGKVKRPVLYIGTAVLLLLLIAGGVFLYVKSALNPLDPGSKVKTKVEIPMGSSAAVIGHSLEKEGIIKDANVFRYYVRLKHESGFMAGNYEFSPSMGVPEIVNRLKNGKIYQTVAFRITIPEGKQLKEIALIIANASKTPEKDVFNKLNDRTFITGLMKKYPDVLTQDILNKNVLYPLEGYLYPATYPFYKDKPTIDEMVEAMLGKTKKELDIYRSEMKTKSIRPHQLLTMASLIEEEATQKADRHKISSVFYNRIQKGMPLQTDPTVLYAQGKHKDRVYYKDLEVNSPYNTYKNAGLPPGPIANAGKMSIEAALHPDKTGFYYFLAASDGTVIFTKTLDEHNREKAKHISSKK